MTSVVCSLFAFATLMLCSSFDCPETCIGGGGQDSSGSMPPGASFYVIKGPAENGNGTDLCAATCIPCKQVVGVFFDGGGTACITITLPGSGPTNPLPKYSRTGYLFALCGQIPCVTFVIDSCEGSGSPFIEVHCLACNC